MTARRLRAGPLQVKHWSWTQLTLTSWHAPYNPTGTRARAHQQTALATLCSPRLFVRLNLDLSNSCSSLPPWTYGNIASARGHVFYLGQVPMSSLLGYHGIHFLSVRHSCWRMLHVLRLCPVSIIPPLLRTHISSSSTVSSLSNLQWHYLRKILYLEQAIYRMVIVLISELSRL